MQLFPVQESMLIRPRLKRLNNPSPRTSEISQPELILRFSKKVELEPGGNEGQLGRGSGDERGELQAQLTVDHLT